MKIDRLELIPRVYHFTDRRNLGLIREHGGLYCLAELTRLGINVPAPGGNDWSHKEDKRRGLDGFVHLCFRERQPMEYLARQKGHIGESIFLQIAPDVLKIPGVEFTSDVANKRGVDSMPIADAQAQIDFEILYGHVEGDSWKRRMAQAEKYEILVPRCVPIQLIENL
jgi:hypothetical protein